jgi:TIR domain/Galactose oxidase, central domain/Kelch motif
MDIGVPKMSQKSSTIAIFCCYAHKDKLYLSELKKHLSALQRQNLIEVWDDGEIRAGTEWNQEIKEHLNKANMILFLISPDFISSNYSYDTEMRRAWERYELKDVMVISVVLRPLSDWEKVPFGKIKLGDLQALPKDAKAITSWRSRDEAWKNVADGVDELLRKSLTPQSTLPFSSLVSVSSQKRVDQLPSVPDSEGIIPHASAQQESRSPTEFYSCFISYSSYDEDIAKRLYTDLQSKGVRCWFAPHHMKIGDKIRSRIDESIRTYDKLLLILSQHSVTSPWVETEVEAAFEQEQQQKKLVLFPVRIDETVMQTKQSWAAEIRRTRYIGDLTHWKDRSSYDQVFTRLLHDLEPDLHSPDQSEGDVAEIPFFPNPHAKVEPLSGGDFGRQIVETLDQSSQREDTKDPPLSQQLEPPRPITTKHRIPRRLVVIGLGGLVTVVGGSGLSWLALSRRLSLPSFQHEAKWVPTGNMLVGRLSLRATTLMNGMVLIEGGFTSGGLHTAESELFNPRTGIWTGTKGRLNETRAQHTATLLLNGNVLVSGGFAGGNTTRDSAELYDPRTDRWTMTKKMGQPRTRHTATRLQDGKVLIVGGVSLNGVYINTAELYDPVADIWSSAGALTIPRADHVAVRLLDDTVLVAGGTLLNDGQTKTSRTEVYDPSTNGWKLAQDMNVPRAYFTAVLLSTGNVLAIGGRAEGFDSTATTELYNPVRGSWSMTGDMNSNRENVPGQEAVILSDGSVLVVGGNVQGTSETYSPATGKWTGQIKMGSVRSNSATALLKSGQVLVVGGFDCFCPNPDNTHILASAEIYAL